MFERYPVLECYFQLTSPFSKDETGKRNGGSPFFPSLFFFWLSFPMKKLSMGLLKIDAKGKVDFLQLKKKKVIWDLERFGIEAMPILDIVESAATFTIIRTRGYNQKNGRVA
jgi:hypothetical protein